MYYTPTTLERALRIEEIFTIHYFEYHKDYVFGGERHDFWELLYIDRGEALVTADDRQFVMSQSQLVFHSPGEFHAISANGVVAPNTIVISFACDSLDMERLTGRIFYVNEFERQLLASIVREANYAFSNDLGDPVYRRLELRPKEEQGMNDFAAQQMLLCNLEMLLISLIRKGGMKSNSAAVGIDQENLWKERVRQVVAWIGQNIDRPISLSEICTKAMMNKSTLERVFRQQMGTSIISYCRQLKIEHAKKMLREEKMNVTQIAERLGFSSIHYFSRTFKKITGMTPSEYALSVKAIIDHCEMTSASGESTQLE